MPLSVCDLTDPLSAAWELFPYSFQMDLRLLAEYFGYEVSLEVGLESDVSAFRADVEVAPENLELFQCLRDLAVRHSLEIDLFKEVLLGTELDVSNSCIELPRK